MTPKERFLSALRGEKADRLPVTTHHVQPYFLNTYMNGMSDQLFFDHFGLDPITWPVAIKPNPARKEYKDPIQPEDTIPFCKRVVSDDWRVEEFEIPNPSYATTRYNIVTPKKTLSIVLQSNEHTAWVVEHLVKEKSDIDIIAEYMPVPLCDVDEINRQAAEYGNRGLFRGHIFCFEIYGQPGCWQDASVCYGIEKLIIDTYMDPEWVKTFLGILRDRKIQYARSLNGAKFDLIELGGGDASTTVISPDIFNEFVAPYDTPIIKAAQEAGQKIVYHTCGGMMPILEDIAAMGVDAMETFTPVGMGADVDLAEAKRRIGDKVCMIGGFDQLHFFTECSEETTRREVRRCFEAAGEGGGFILCPSDHFFDADLKLIAAFADEARKCTY
jgi:uroporphyrinogen decarboxylase